MSPEFLLHFFLLFRALFRTARLSAEISVHEKGSPHYTINPLLSLGADNVITSFFYCSPKGKRAEKESLNIITAPERKGRYDFYFTSFLLFTRFLAIFLFPFSACAREKARKARVKSSEQEIEDITSRSFIAFPIPRYFRAPTISSASFHSYFCLILSFFLAFLFVYYFSLFFLPFGCSFLFLSLRPKEASK